MTVERMRQCTAESIRTADKSHLEPLQMNYYANVDWGRQRIDSLPRSTCSLLYVPDLPLDDFFTPKPTDKNYSAFDRFERQLKTDLEIRSSNAAEVELAEGDGSRESHFIEENRQSLPVVDVKKAVNLYFSGLGCANAETVKSLGLSNTQTIAGRPAKTRINRSDFLAR
ncbi:MAG: hypothetical protein Q8Q50_06005 [Methylobacter sp.]|nr:hypothetical protein [Methylobacter sp.]